MGEGLTWQDRLCVRVRSCVHAARRRAAHAQARHTGCFRRCFANETGTSITFNFDCRGPSTSTYRVKSYLSPILQQTRGQLWCDRGRTGHQRYSDRGIGLAGTKQHMDITGLARPLRKVVWCTGGRGEIWALINAMCWGHGCWWNDLHGSEGRNREVVDPVLDVPLMKVEVSFSLVPSLRVLWCSPCLTRKTRVWPAQHTRGDDGDEARIVLSTVVPLPSDGGGRQGPSTEPISFLFLPRAVVCLAPPAYNVCANAR